MRLQEMASKVPLWTLEFLFDSNKIVLKPRQRRIPLRIYEIVSGWMYFLETQHIVAMIDERTTATGYNNVN